MKKLEECLRNLRIHHAFGMATLLYVQPNIGLLTEQDVFKAEEIDDDLCVKINWGFEIEKTKQNEIILQKAEILTDDEQEEYFKNVYKHFNIEQNY